MAYVLGLIFADGAIIDARKSSRACYIALTSIDKSLLKQVKKALSSSHVLYRTGPHITSFRGGKFYLCKEKFTWRIANKNIYQDLLNLGLTPKKSLTISLPKIPLQYFSYFLRGYFDGDGCIYVGFVKGRRLPSIKTILTSGSQNFLNSISEKLHVIINTPLKNPFKNGNAFRLIYNKNDSLKFLQFMYLGLEKAPFLERKYQKYLSAYGA